MSDELNRVALRAQVEYVDESQAPLKARLKRALQEQVLAEVQGIIRAAPLFQPTMPGSGVPYSLRMTNAGSLGWVSDRAGYRYQPEHPITGKPWPAIPRVLLDLWSEITRCERLPDACLVNVYGPKSKLGRHRDRDEYDLTLPVLSISLGATATFCAGDRTFALRSGDVVLLAGPWRDCYHGVFGVERGSSPLSIQERVNLTLRCAGPG